MVPQTVCIHNPELHNPKADYDTSHVAQNMEVLTNLFSFFPSLTSQVTPLHPISRLHRQQCRVHKITPHIESIGGGGGF